MEVEKIIDLVKNFTEITKDYSLNITEQYFNEKYAYKEKPVIFKKAFQDWNIKELWTQDYLNSKFRNTKECLERSFLMKSVKQDFTFSDYINYIKLEEVNPYYFLTQMHLFKSELWKDYNSPEIFNCWYKNSKNRKQKTYLSWLFIGSKNSGTDIHQDVWGSSAWNYLISGKKLWIFYPSSLNMFIENNKQSYEVSGLLTNNTHSPPLVIVQNPGDLVFTPPNWYHGVVNLDTTISLTENFINQTNYESILDNFKKNRSHEDQMLLSKIIYDGFTKIERYEN